MQGYSQLFKLYRTYTYKTTQEFISALKLNLLYFLKSIVTAIDDSYHHLKEISQNHSAVTTYTFIMYSST